jgi:hypothetical protein
MAEDGVVGVVGVDRAPGIAPASCSRAAPSPPAIHARAGSARAASATALASPASTASRRREKPPLLRWAALMAASLSAFVRSDGGRAIQPPALPPKGCRTRGLPAAAKTSA